MTTVFIKGLGLIGSSLARAIREGHPDIRILDSDPDPKTQEYALSQQLADQILPGLQGAEGADYIILAGPVDAIKADIRQLSQMELKKGVLVTDVGSVKQAIVDQAQALSQKGVDFIAGHPMAGSHKTGAWAGRALLFENAFYFLIPASQAAEKRLPELEDLLKATRVKWLQLTAEEHDKIVAQISHLPHIIAAGLVNQTEETFAGQPLGTRLAAGGFKSITRIASSDPTMWSQILLNNSEDILKQLAEFQAELKEVAMEIAAGDEEALYDFFQKAKISRDKLGPDQVGAAPGHYDLFVNIPDQVGALADVTRLLAEAGISIVSLQILEIREEIDGVLQLTFAREADRRQAKEILAAYELKK